MTTQPQKDKVRLLLLFKLAQMLRNHCRSGSECRVMQVICISNSVSKKSRLSKKELALVFAGILFPQQQ